MINYNTSTIALNSIFYFETQHTLYYMMHQNKVIIMSRPKFGNDAPYM